MKKRFFRAITLLLAAAVVLGMLVFSPVASAESSGGWVYEVINGGALIVGYYGPAGDITVPSSIGGYPVTGLNGELFMDNKSITGITIADSVFSIGGKAFSGCTNLTKSKLPSSLKTIDPWTFFECKKLTSLVIPNFVTGNVTTMKSMFRECRALTTLTLPTTFTTQSVTDMSYMFYYCPSLTSLNLSSFYITSVNNMQAMFMYCRSLTSLNLAHFDMSHLTSHSYYTDGASQNLSGKYDMCNGLSTTSHNCTITCPLVVQTEIEAGTGLPTTGVTFTWVRP